MNVFGFVKHGAAFVEGVATENGTLAAVSACKTALSFVPGANMALGATVDKVFAEESLQSVGREYVEQVEQNYHKHNWRQEIDDAGNNNGEADLDDISEIAGDAADTFLDAVGNVIEKLADF